MGLSERDAVQRALGDLELPVVLDVDCGHVVPQLALVNAAMTRVRLGPGMAQIEQSLV